MTSESDDIFTLHGGTYARELRIAAGAARAAGAIALKYHGTKITVDLKAGNEPVTIADRECSASIVATLAAAFPDDVIISEENHDDRRRLQASRVWYVDPIDGTKDFIRGKRGYCVMIGLACQHQPVAGVIYQPNHDSLVFASHDCGAWALRGSTISRLATSSIEDPGDARLLASRTSRTGEVDRIKELLGISREENIGSIGLKLAAIALGECDLYVNPATHCSSWDTCAPQIILEEAGGILSDVHGCPLRYDNADTLRHSRGLVASNGTMHKAAITRLSALFSQVGTRTC